MSMPFSTGAGRRLPISYLLVIVWLVGLTVASAMSLVIARDLAGQAQVDAQRKDMLAADARIASLVESVDAIRAEPQAASSSALHAARQQLEQRLVKLEQAQADLASSMHLEMLREEVEQLKAAKTTPTAVVPKLVTKPKHPAPRQALRELPFRVIGIERRADERFLAVAPATGPLLSSQIQVLRLGESFDTWQLQSIDSGMATFRDGQQTRQVVIPNQ